MRATRLREGKATSSYETKQASGLRPVVPSSCSRGRVSAEERSCARLFGSSRKHIEPERQHREVVSKTEPYPGSNEVSDWTSPLAALSSPTFPTRREVCVHPEEVRRVVPVLERGQPLKPLAVGRLDFDKGSYLLDGRHGGSPPVGHGVAVGAQRDEVRGRVHCSLVFRERLDVVDLDVTISSGVWTRW